MLLFRILQIALVIVAISIIAFLLIRSVSAGDKIDAQMRANKNESDRRRLVAWTKDIVSRVTTEYVALESDRLTSVRYPQLLTALREKDGGYFYSTMDELNNFTLSQDKEITHGECSHLYDKAVAWEKFWNATLEETKTKD